MDRPHAATITAVLYEGPGTVRLVLDRAWDAHPGQFAMVWLPGKGEKPLSVLAPDPLTLCVRVSGPLTQALCSLGPGDRLGVRGPYGTGFTLPEGKRALLVAGGMGAVPLAFLARELSRENEVTILQGARTADQLVLRCEMATAGEQHLFTDDGSCGTACMVTEPLDDHLRRTDVVYACGPEPMMAVVLRRASSAVVPSELSVERYMKCGIGLCGSCHVGGICACTEGPVLPGKRLLATEFGHHTRDAAGRRVPV